VPRRDTVGHERIQPMIPEMDVVELLDGRTALVLRAAAISSNSFGQ